MDERHANAVLAQLPANWHGIVSRGINQFRYNVVP